MLAELCWLREQVSRQGARKAVELSQCRSKLQRAEHMLTAAYAANAAMQVRLQQASHTYLAVLADAIKH